MAPLESIRQMSRQVSRSSHGEYQADEQAGVAGLTWRVSGRGAGRCRGAQLASIRKISRQVSGAQLASIRKISRQVSGAQLARIRQMSGQGTRGSAGEYHADEEAGVARLSWRVSGR